jgi:eukaryotic-like serine/threonine-protein kinase
MSEAQKVAELVKSALDLPPGERGAFLDQACAGDADLRSEVDSFLKFQPEASQFIEQGALHLAAQTVAGTEIPLLRQIDGHEVISRIGVGGMGEVYLAKDTKLKRRVALKLVRAGMDSADLVSRFRHEERILASLNHPNIAQLFGAGIAAGDIPYFAMEYVEGSRIDEYCKANALSAHARLELFRKVCAAVHYAHQRLVIHRDLKPSNILVTEQGEPKLLDFGIAKLIEGNDVLTQTPTLVTGVMTPDYASPEQVRGEAMTTSTDVYSLGVLLYELLTSQRPYRLKTRSADEIARAITDQEPERPSTAIGRADGNSKLEIQNSKFPKGDLDNIVLMALRKEPARRYASVGQFSEDIRRYLEGLPVVAHKDTVSYRATKFIKRNKLAVAAATVVILSLVGGIIATVWQARRAEANQARAEKRFADVRGLANALLNDIAPKIERLEGATEARQALIAQSLRYLDSLAGEAATDLSLQAELAAAYEKVGVLQGDSRKPSLSDFRGAIASLEKAQQIRRHLLAIKPNDADNRRLLADNLRLLAIRRMAQSDVEGGLKDSKEALRIYDKLVTEMPGSLELQKAFLEAQVEDAMNFGKDAEAIPPLQQVAGKIDELLRTASADTETERILARCLAALGIALSWENRQPEAETEMTRAVTIAESLVARFPNDMNLKQDLWKIYESASGIYEQIDDARAFELCDKSRRIAEEIIAADRANAQARHNLSKSFSRLGISASNLDRPVEALDLLERARTIVLELQEKDPLNRGYDRDLSVLYIRIGLARVKQGDLTGALAAYLKSAELYEKQLADDPANTIGLYDLAIAYRHAGLVHKELAKSDDQQIRQVQRAAEKENYQRALNSLLKAQAQKALPEFSRKLIETYRKDIEELEKLR